MPSATCTGPGKRCARVSASAVRCWRLIASSGEPASVQMVWYLRAERAGRKANCKKINDHFGVERATLLDPSDFAAALEMLAKFEAGKDPFKDEDDEDNSDSPI